MNIARSVLEHPEHNVYMKKWHRWGLKTSAVALNLLGFCFRFGRLQAWVMVLTFVDNNRIKQSLSSHDRYNIFRQSWQFLSQNKSKFVGTLCQLFLLKNLKQYNVMIQDIIRKCLVDKTNVICRQLHVSHEIPDEGSFLNGVIRHWLIWNERLAWFFREKLKKERKRQTKRHQSFRKRKVINYAN